MSRRTYGQFCGLARALEMVGERWAMLVVRDLLLGPKRFTQLRAGLPKLPPSMLAARLNELEEAGVIRRRVTTELDASIVYELTEYGAELETIVLQLALWGARTLGDSPTEDELFTFDSAILSLYTTFRADLAEGVDVDFVLHFGPDMAVRAAVHDATLVVTDLGDLHHLDDVDMPEPDLVILPRGPMMPIMSGEVSARDAVDRGMVEISAPVELLELFQRLFHIPPGPLKADGLAGWEAPTAVGIA